MKISIEQLEFPMCIKNKILRIKDITKLHIDYIAAKYIRFSKTNMAIQEPHKIILSNETSSIVLLAYGGDSNIYLNNLSSTVTKQDLTKIISILLTKKIV